MHLQRVGPYRAVQHCAGWAARNWLYVKGRLILAGHSEEGIDRLSIEAVAGAVYALRYDEASRSDVQAACAGNKEPPFLDAFLDEMAVVEADERLSSPADVMAWAARAARALGGG